MDSGIYCILNTVNNKRYIGQSQNIKNRWEIHIRALNSNKHENSYLQAAWLKYGNQSFKFMVIEYCELALLDEREQYWINFYDTLNNGYNLCAGGKGIRGYRHTDQEIAKMIQIQHPKSCIATGYGFKYHQ